MIQNLLKREEGKTLEFKENAKSLPGIIKTVVSFDERPCSMAPKNGLDWKSIEVVFAADNKKITKNKAKSMGMLTTFSGSDQPSNGGMLLFGSNRLQFFPDAIIRCVRFAGIGRTHSIDHRDIDKHLPTAIDDVLDFITKNTFTATKIGPKKRVNILQYPDVAIREVVINAIVHTDYSIKGSSIIVAIFDDRIEITNPGGMAYGLSLEDALAGSSRARNRVIVRAFHHLGLVEQWGSGLQKIIESCLQKGLGMPRFEEMGSQFRVTIYSTKVQKATMADWQKSFFEHVNLIGEISAKDAAKFWKIDIRSTRRRLKKLVDDGVLMKIGVSKNDPYSRYVVCPR